MIAIGAIFIILGLILLVVGIIAEVCDWGDGSSLTLGWFAGALIFLGLWGVYEGNNSHNKPTAMDVYQGKTTLKYTVIDSVKVDSTVVWKPKE